MSRFSRSMSLLSALLVAFALVAVSCGDDAVSDVVADPGDGSVTDPQDSAAPGASAPEDVDGDAQAAEFCALSERADDAADQVDLAVASPAEAEAFMRSQMAMAQEGLAIAPASVSDEMQRLVDAMVAAADVLESADWDFLAADDLLAPIYEDPEFVAAGEVLDAFDTDVCGIEPDEPETGGGATPELTAELEAYCSFSAEIAGRGVLPLDGTPDEVQAYYDQLVADIARGSSIAPAEIAGDYDIAAGVFDEIYTIMSSGDFVVTEAQPDIDAYTADAEVSDAMDGAIGRIEQFDTEVCGLS